MIVGGRRCAIDERPVRHALANPQCCWPPTSSGWAVLATGDQSSANRDAVLSGGVERNGTTRYVCTLGLERRRRCWLCRWVMLQHDCVPVFRTAVLSLLKTGNGEFRPPSARSEIAEPTGRKHVWFWWNQFGEDRCISLNWIEHWISQKRHEIEP